jgi:hypothetical protein
MSYKTFFINNNQNNFSEKLLVANNVYPKYIIRNNVKTLDNKNSLVIDTGDLLFLSLKKTFKLGFSFYAKNIVFSHKLNKNLRFSSFLCFNKPKKEYASAFLKSINRFIIKSISKRYLFLILVKPVKGGFIGFCNNFFGFVPRSQLCFMTRVFSRKKVLSRKKKLNLIFLNSAKRLTKFISYKLRVRTTNLTLSPCTIRSAFSGRSRYHFLRRKNKVNFVFMYKKLKKKVKKNIQIKKNRYAKKYIQRKKA